MVAGAILFVFPYHALAQLQGPPADPGLVQCGRLGSGSNTSFCDLCDLIALVKNILDYIWKGAWVLAAAMLIYGGFYMILPSFSAGGAGMYEKGKKILTNTAWGLLIIFFAWIIIDTIIKVAANQSLTSGVPAQLPQSTRSTFTSQGTQDEEAVQSAVTLNRIKLGPWNKIECKRAPERAPIALLEIPPEFRCVQDCDPATKQSYEAWANGNGSSIAGTPVGGSCTNGVLKNYEADIEYWANYYGFDVGYFQALLIHESGGQTAVVSNKNAIGLVQMTIPTVKDLGLVNGLSDQRITEKLKDPKFAVMASATLINNLRKRTYIGGNYSLVTAGYNGGAWAAAPAKKDPGCAANGTLTYLCEAYPGYSETRKMVPAVNAVWDKIKSGSCTPGA